MRISGSLRSSTFNKFIGTMLANPPPMLRRAEKLADLSNGLCRPTEATHLPSEFALCVYPKEEIMQIENYYLIHASRSWITVEKKSGLIRAGGNYILVAELANQYFGVSDLTCIE